jgi:hypothetical protein
MRRLHADAQADEPSMRAFGTAVTGAAPGAVTAAAQTAPPNVGPATSGLNSYFQSLTPNILKDAIRGASPGSNYRVPGPGLVPSLADLQAAAARDPTVRSIYEEEVAKSPPPEPSSAQRFNAGVESVVSRIPGLGMIPRAIRAAGPSTLPPSPQEMPDLASRVFARLSQLNAGPELQWAKENPWSAATVQIPGEAIKMAPALGAAAVAGPLGLVPSALAFDQMAQAQAVNVGAQEGYEQGQGAMNIASLLSGGLAGRSWGNRLVARGAEAEVAKRAAARVANTVMTAVPTAVQAGEGMVRKATDNEPFDWNSLLVSLYKGVGEAAILSSVPEIAPGQQRTYYDQHEALARERSRAIFGGDRTFHDILSKMEDETKRLDAIDHAGPSYVATDELKTSPLSVEEPFTGGSFETPKQDLQPKVMTGHLRYGEAPPPEPKPVEWTRVGGKLRIKEAPEDHTNAVRAMESAQDALLRAHASEAEQRMSRDARREVVERGMHPDAKPEDQAAYDAMRVLERDIRNEPPDSARRLYYGSRDYADRLAAQFGITNEEHIQMLHELGADIVTEPHRKSKSQGGFLRVGRETEAERADRERDETAQIREHQRVSAEAPEQLRSMVNRIFSKMTGRKAPLVPHVDPGLRGHQLEESVRFRDMATQDRIAYRAIQDLYKMAPPENAVTMDRIFTMAADDPRMESVALANLPEEMRPAFTEAQRQYRELATRHGKEGLELGAIPQAIHEERGFTESGKLIRQEVVTKKGQKYEGKGKLVGGFDKYTGQWVHHDFGVKLRENLPRWMGGKERTSNEMERLEQADVPSSFRRRTKTRDEWVQQGNVSIDPSFHEMSRQRQVFRLRSDLNYLRDNRPDLYRTQSDFVGDIESVGATVRKASEERLPQNKAEFEAHKRWMEKNGVPVFAGESGPLTREMQRNLRGLSEKLNAQIKYMGERQIPFYGEPENFHPDDPMYRRRAKELRREQAKYATLQRQLWTHSDLNNPDTWMGTRGHLDQQTIDANTKLRELFDERLMLENNLNSKWVQLKGAHKYGEHAGSYVNSNSLREIEVHHDAAETAPSIFLELSKTFKFMRVPANFIRSFAMQFTGNSMTNMMGGVHLTPAGMKEWVTATEHVFDYLWSQGKNVSSDPIFQEMLNHGRLTGALALYDVPHVLREQVFSALAEAKREMEHGSVGDATRNYIAAALRAMRYYPSQLPVFGRGIQMVSAMDLIPQYAMVRQLVTGNGSTMGKMDVGMALTHSGYLYDMNSVPRWVEDMAQNKKWYKFWPTFVRWLYKGTAGPLQWMMASPPTIGTYGVPGLKVAQPFGKRIAANEGTPEGTKYVWMSKATNLALNAAKFITHLGVAAHYSARIAGFDPDDEEFKNRKIAVAGGDRVRAFLLQTIGERDGQPIFWDPTNLTPLTSPLTLGVAPDERNNDSAASRGIHWLLSLNWMLNAGTHIVERKDFAGRDIPLDQAIVESMKNFVPGAVEMPLTSIWNATRPWSRKTLGEAMLQAFSGLTLRPSSPLDDEAMRMRRLAEAGDIKYIKDPIPLTTRGTFGLRMHNRNLAIRMQQAQRRIQRLSGDD